MGYQTIKLIDNTTGFVFDAYVKEGEEVDFSVFTNDVTYYAPEPVRVGADRNIVIEPEVQADAVTEKQIALIEAELAELSDGVQHRRAVVKSITLGGTVRVSIQKWQRIIPRPDEKTVGDTYKWVELKSVRV